MINAVTNSVMLHNAALIGQGRRVEEDVPQFNDMDSVKLEEGGRDAVRVSLSIESKDLLAQLQGEFLAPSKETEIGNHNTLKKDRKSKSKNEKELSEDKEELVKDLENRDTQPHHVAAAAGYVRGRIHYEFQTGPDGLKYAIGNHVELDTSAIPNESEKTIQEPQVIRQTLLAGGEASSSDIELASAASSMEHQVGIEILEESNDKQGKSKEKSTRTAKETLKEAYEKYEGVSLPGMLVSYEV